MEFTAVQRAVEAGAIQTILLIRSFSVAPHIDMDSTSATTAGKWHLVEER